MARKKNTQYYIYKITCLINNRFYVGMHCTRNLKDGYLGSGRKLKVSIKKYGEKNHKKEILEFCKDRTELKQKEKQIVNEQFLKNPMCMNLQIGGGGGFISEEHARKFHIAGAIAVNKIRREKLAEKIQNDPKWKKQWLNNVSKGLKKYYKTHDNPMLGKTHSDEARMKISIGQTGENNSQFGTQWITNGKKIKKIIKNTKIPHGWKIGRKLNE